MADLKHTPGPWKVDEDDDVVSATGLWVAFAYGDSEEEAKHNARLIAAAPDLLEALRALLSAAERMVDKAPVMGRTEAEAMDRARLAIDRATGEGT